MRRRQVTDVRAAPVCAGAGPSAQSTTTCRDCRPWADLWGAVAMTEGPSSSTPQAMFVPVTPVLTPWGLPPPVGEPTCSSGTPCTSVPGKLFALVSTTVYSLSLRVLPAARCLAKPHDRGMFASSPPAGKKVMVGAHGRSASSWPITPAAAATVRQRCGVSSAQLSLTHSARRQACVSPGPQRRQSEAG
jgi:hypothetical protein